MRQVLCRAPPAQPATQSRAAEALPPAGAGARGGRGRGRLGPGASSARAPRPVSASGSRPAGPQRGREGEPRRALLAS